MQDYKEDDVLEEVHGGFSWGGLVNGAKKVANVAGDGLDAAKDAGLF